MDSFSNAVLGVRRNEDIALDLLKFVAGTTSVGRPVAGSTGFSGSAGSKPEDQVNQLLDLYTRCLHGGRQRGGAIGGDSILRVAVAGTGAFGRNHLRVYHELETAGTAVKLAAAIEPDAERAAETAAKYGIPVFSSADELLRGLEAGCGELWRFRRCITTRLRRRCWMRGSMCWWRSRLAATWPRPTT